MTGMLLAAGVSHRTASLAVRERLELSESRADALLAELATLDEIREAVAVSTCNRTELYLVAHDFARAEGAASAALARAGDMRRDELNGALRSLRGTDAVRHLFRVTAGLDSMIVGEAEVQGQVRRAHELALARGTTGPIANRLFHDALRAGKRVRSETGVCRSRVSVASVAVDLARRTLGHLAERRVLVIGAGRHGELTARALADQGARTVFVANRASDRAAALAERFGGCVVRFDDLPSELARADLVLSSTSCPERILTRRGLEPVTEKRAGRTLVLIDTAVPRDVDPAARGLPGLELYDLDDLQRAVAQNLTAREEEAVRATPIVEEEVARFEHWLASLEVIPTISALRERGRAAVDRALRENETRWQALTDDDRERVELVARAVVSDLLHEPTLRLKRVAGDQESGVYVQTLRDLFGLGSPPGTQPAEAASDQTRRAGSGLRR